MLKSIKIYVRKICHVIFLVSPFAIQSQEWEQDTSNSANSSFSEEEEVVGVIDVDSKFIPETSSESYMRHKQPKIRMLIQMISRLFHSRVVSVIRLFVMFLCSSMHFFHTFCNRRLLITLVNVTMITVL